MDTTYYDHGTPAERWERARLFFEAEDYAAAARVLARLVEEVPEQTGPRLLLARAYYHSAQLRRRVHTDRPHRAHALRGPGDVRPGPGARDTRR
ncbi:tetratricopeptide repeat protein, partial [Streptomyces sp. NPDC004599]